MKFIGTILGLLASVDVATAQSAKFAAAYNSGTIVASSAECTAAMTAAGTPVECDDLDADDAIAAKMATIHVAQQKELLVGVSAQVELFTMTEVKGKRGSVTKALASASGAVNVEACTADGECATAVPSLVTLAARTQEMSATLAGVIEECEVTLVDETGSGIPDYGEFDLSDCTVSEEELKMATTTMAAHHYNFVLPNLKQGTYDLKVKFFTEAGVEAAASCGDPNPDANGIDSPSYTSCIADAVGIQASAEAMAVISNTMVTAQEVRAVKGSMQGIDV